VSVQKRFLVERIVNSRKELLEHWWRKRIDPLKKGGNTGSTLKIFEEQRTLKGYSKQLRLDSVLVEQVELNLGSRDRIVPVLRAIMGLGELRSNGIQVENHSQQCLSAEARNDRSDRTGVF
jgi:hypothetical protein